jgi:hypothetical protein
MSEPSQDPLPKNPERAAREERLAKALRDNLRRRKEQARLKTPRGTRSGEPREGEGGSSA